jgi:hypothetical protein
MTLLFIFRRVMRRKFIGGSDQKFLEIGSRNFPPVVDISQRLFIADPISHPIGTDVGSNATLAAIIDHPVLWHLGERAVGAKLMHEGESVQKKSERLSVKWARSTIPVPVIDFSREGSQNRALRFLAGT